MAELEKGNKSLLEIVSTLSNEQWIKVRSLVNSDPKYKKNQTAENAQLIANHIGIKQELSLDEVRELYDKSDKFCALATCQPLWFEDLINGINIREEKWQSDEWKFFLLIEMKEDKRFN